MPGQWLPCALQTTALEYMRDVQEEPTLVHVLSAFLRAKDEC